MTIKNGMVASAYSVENIVILKQTTRFPRKYGKYEWAGTHIILKKYNVL